MQFVKEKNRLIKILKILTALWEEKMPLKF